MSDGTETPPDGAVQQRLDSSEWKVVNGRLMRRAKSQPHERSVSARQDAAGHGILPRLSSNETKSPAARRKLLVQDEQSPPRVVWMSDYKNGKGSSPELSRSASCGGSPGSRQVNDWCAGQLHLQQLLNVGAVSPSPRETDSTTLDEEVAIRNFSRPSNRSEAVQLAQNLERRLQASRADFRATERSWQVTFCEVVRQVYVHCAERGELLDRVRRWYELELKRLNLVIRKARERERKLQETARAEVDNNFTMAELDASIAVNSQRLELMQMMVKKTGPRGLGKLVAEGTRDCPLTEKHEMLNELLPQMMPLPRATAVSIVSSASAAGPEAQFVLMQRMLECVDPSLRSEMLVELLASSEGGMEEAADTLADTLQLAVTNQGGMHGMEGAARAQKLVSKLVPGMADTSRGAAIGAILSNQTTAQKATALGDALHNLPDSDTPSVLKELIEHLSPEDRTSLVHTLLSDLASGERVGILRRLFERAKPIELTSMLSGRAQNLELLAAMPPEMLKNLLKELPTAVDGDALAGILPPEALRVWGAKLLGAAPEDACKAWLSQLLDRLKMTSTDSALSQLLVGEVSPEVFAYAYANLGMDQRLRMLTGVHELKQQGAVSPAPFSKQEVDLLVSLLDLRPSSDSPASSTNASPFGSPKAGNHMLQRRGSVLAAMRRGSVLGPLPSIGAGGVQRIKEKFQLIPLEQTMRTIADIYLKKIKEDQTADSKHKLRCPMVKFVRNYLLRQYGMKSMADKALRELTATVRAYSMGSESLVRARMFAESAGLLKDAQGATRPPWPDRKTDFFLFLIVKFARCIKEEAAAASAGQQPVEGVSRFNTTLKFARRGSLAHFSSSRMPHASGSVNGASNLWTNGPASGLKEILCREEVMLSPANLQSVVDTAVRDPVLSPKVLARIQQHGKSEEELLTGQQEVTSFHLDDVLEIFMLVWDEQEEYEAPRLTERLNTIFQDAATDGNGRMSFNQFERFCASLSNSSIDEDHILDMFDEAIRVTEEALGEETDTASPEGFARVATRYNLVSLSNLSLLADAVAVGRQEIPRTQRDGDGAESPSRAGDHPAAVRRAERSKRTVIKTSSSKANERSLGQDKRHGATEKPESVYRVIRTAVQSHFLFRHLDEAMHRELVQRMVPVPVMPGYDVIKQGDKGDYFYVAESGTFDVIVNEEKVHTYIVQPDEDKYPCFGELALLYAKPRAATIRAAGPGMLWGLDRRGFRSVQMFSSNVDLTKLLKRMEVLSSLPFNSLQTLMNHMVEQNFGGGEYVFRQGDLGDSMYVIMSGTACVTKTRSPLASEQDADVCEEEVMQLEEEMYFGERALLDNAPRAASVRAITSLKCMAIDRATFERLLGPLQHIIDADRQRRENEASMQMMQLEAAGLSGASFSSFKFQAPMMRLDTGGLLAVHHLVSNETYTVRAESKLKLYELDQVDRVARELELMRTNSLGGHLPMLPALLCTFASPIALFALFKTRVACELSYFMELVGGRLSRETARFISACVVAALERLHCRMGAVYRNLSPDALAVDEKGYVCLMDFRQAKTLSGNKTYTLCGVADYLAPEQVTCSGHGFPVDLWSLGILLWEVSAGVGPWGNDPNEMNIYKHITDHEKGALSCRLQDERDRGFLPPDAFAPTLVDLIDRLLAPDPLSRLGAAANEGAAAHGFEELKCHTWFASIRWTQLVEGDAQSPLISSATTHMREQLEAHAHCSSDAVHGELVGTTEYSGDGSWFATY